ncbi:MULTISPECIES: LrgB family protein [Anaerococcus]|uniref:LrgB family protein n=1 Tax=Anaerococcus TaxID=165779 RepID=UPI00242D5B99|nr:LrgB family protein [Anaerococcus vaginalis]MBS6921885.1 LrgB family protein [Anaerococcus vaginalis]MDU1707769.1 LrgB family protein [Anaerococcus vaginalis]MDU1762731.1 LrgB family protein [Anaerococcus vaginalis]MDU5989398.1 LrgB family protein [Anaerococcus vaginalis]
MLDNQYFGIVLSFAAYEIGKWINKKLKTPIANPLLIAILLIIGFLSITGIDYEYYKKGGDFIAFFIGPATVAMVLDLYANLDTLKKNILPILVGVGFGTIFSFVLAIFLSKIFQIDKNLVASLIPQSITTAIAISLSGEYQGIIGLTAIVVVIRGVSGAVFAPIVMKIFRIKDPVAQGVAIGTSSHAVGTSQARLMGEIQGAMSGLSIAISGITAVIIMPLAMKLVEIII